MQVFTEQEIELLIEVLSPQTPDELMKVQTMISEHFTKKSKLPPEANGKAISYLRWSSEAQSHGDSLRRQLELSADFCEETGLILDSTLRDDGVSAYDKSNLKGAFGGFLDAVRKGTIPAGTTLIVESLDRLSRAKPIDALQVFLEILKSGILIITLADRQIYTQQTITDDFSKLIISIVIMQRAHEESATKSKRLRAAWDNKRKNIDTKILTAQCPGWLTAKRDKSGFEFIPQHAETVKFIFEQSLNNMGSYTIGRMLNQNKIPTFRNAKTWGHSYVEKILHSPAVHGELHPQHQRDGAIVKVGEPIPDYYPAVISKETFNLVCAMRTSRRKTGGRRGPGLSNLFSGLLKCGYCGGSMIMAGYVKPMPDGTKKTGKYLVCHDAKKGCGCKCIQWQYPDLEEMVLKFCKEIDFAEILNNNTIKSATIVQRSKVIALELDITEKEKKLKTLLTAIEDGSAPLTIVKRMEQLEEELEVAKICIEDEKIALNVMEAETISGDDQQRTVIELFERMRSLEGDELYQLRVRLSGCLHRVFDRIVLYPGGNFGEEYKADTLGKLMGLGGHDEPDKASRYLTVFFKSGQFRVVTVGGVAESLQSTPEGTRVSGRYTT